MTKKPLSHTEEIQTCKTKLIQFPFIFNMVFRNGEINTLLLYNKVYTMYRLCRELRPDILHYEILSINSMVVACRVLDVLYREFPCIFELR